MREPLVLILYLGIVLTCELDKARACPTNLPVSNILFSQVYPPVSEVTEEAVTPLYVGLMSSTEEEQIQTSCLLSSVRTALDAINLLPNFLEGYRLHFTLTQSQCRQRETVGDLFKQLFQSPGNGNTLGLISSRCPEANRLSSNVLSYYNVPRVTCVPSSEDLEVKYHSFFQVFPSDKEIVMAVVTIVTEYGWKRIAGIVEDSYRFKEMSVLLREQLELLNVSYSEVVLPTSNSLLDFNKHSDFSPGSNFRIFIVAMQPRFARQLFCKAYHLGMRFPKYLYLTFSSYESRWWIPPADEYVDHQCTPEQRAEVLHNSLSIINSPGLIENADINTPVGTVARNYSNDTQTKRCAAANTSSSSDAELAPYCYDAIWAVALALNKTILDLKSNATFLSLVGQVGLEDFVYSNYLLSERIRHHIHETDFYGITGHIQFDERGLRIMDRLKVLQYRTCTVNDTHRDCNMFGSLVQVEFGSIARGQFQYVNDESFVTVWPGYSPYDGSVREEISTIAIPLVVIYDLVATAGIVFSVICFAFNFCFRHKKIVRLTSPNLNYLILIGAIFSYTATYIYFIPSNNASVNVASCSLQVLIVSVSNTLVMATIIAKLWRIYYIFRNPHSVKKYTISDWKLVIIVFSQMFLILGLTLVYFIVEGSVSQFQPELKRSSEMSFGLVGEQEIYTCFYIYSCSSVPLIRNIALLIIFLDFVGLQLFALFLAFKTRKVKIKGLNDAKYITAIVFLTGISIVIFICLSFTVRFYVNIFPALFNGLSLFTNTAILLLVFLPKMISLYKDPEGEHVFGYAEEEVAQISTVFVDKVQCKDCQLLRRKVIQLEKICNSRKNGRSLFDTVNLRRSCPLLVPQVPTPVCLSVTSSTGSASLASSTKDRCVSYGIHRSVSLSEFGDSIQIGERV